MRVLGSGFVELVDMMGDDYSILRAARVSTGSVSKDNKRDKKLIEYLYKNEHSTPFEHVVFTFHIRSPLFVNQQILRHRTFSFSQESGRYKEFDWDCFVPKEWRKQDTKNKQSSFSGGFRVEDQENLTRINEAFFAEAKRRYETNLQYGVAKEHARIVMPMAQYTELYFTCDLRNLLHFLELRLSPHSQLEIQEYAKAILKIIEDCDKIPWTIEIFKKRLDLIEFLLLK